MILGQVLGAQPGTTFREIPKDRAFALAKTLLESLVFHIRGNEGLDLPPYARQQIRKIADRVADRMQRGLVPSLTKSDAVQLYKIAKK